MKLKAPEGCGSVSFAGQEYQVVDGHVHVPPEAAATLLEPGWGFTPAAPRPEKTLAERNQEIINALEGAEEAGEKSQVPDAPRKTENGKRKTGK